MIIMKKIYLTLLAAMALLLLPHLPSQSQNLSQISIRKVGLAIIAALCCKDSHGILIMNHNGKF